MNIRFGTGDKEADAKRQEKIKKLLPTQTIIASTLEPAIESRLFDILNECLKTELEIYRKYPKRPEKGVAFKEVEKDFDPRDNDKCFMGKAFKANSDATDIDLVEYRKAIGTINHPVWGNCTLLEIWGGDHFEEYNEMVVGAFRYGMNKSDELPEIKFHINPLFQNKRTKNMSEAKLQYKQDMDDLLAKAIVFGVRTPKEAIKARKRS